MGRRNEPRDVPGHRFRQKDPFHRGEDFGEAVRADGFRRIRRFPAPPGGDDAFEGVHIRARNVQLEQKPVELRFRQRVGAFEFDGILRGEDEKRIGQPPRRAEQRDRLLLHGFEQRRLRLRRGAVDFVGEHDVGEDRSRMERQFTHAGRVFLKDVRAENVARHEVGRELDALEFKAEQQPERLDERGFAHAGQTFEENVSAADDADEHETVEFGSSEQNAVEFVEGGEREVGDRREVFGSDY